MVARAILMVSFFLGAGSFSTAFVPQQRFISPNVRASVRMGLSVGDKFPDKALKSWGVSSKPCVVYFYGGDGSPSCTKEANAFDEALSDFKALGVTVVGVRNEVMLPTVIYPHFVSISSSFFLVVKFCLGWCQGRLRRRVWTKVCH